MTNINKYQYGVIYKITNTEDPDLVYIGSTTSDLNVRMIKHKSDAKNRPGLSKLYTYMNEIGIDKFEIVEVEQYPCESVKELRKREGEFIKQLGTLNIAIAGRTNKEYAEEFKDYLKEWKKQHYQDNKEILAEKGKLYYQDNKERIREQHKEYRLEHLEEEKERAKLYRESNQDKIREYKKQWCEENRERLLEQKKQYYQENKEELRTKHKEYYENNKGELLKKNKEYYQTHINEKRNMTNFIMRPTKTKRENKPRYDTKIIKNI